MWFLNFNIYIILKPHILENQIGEFCIIAYFTPVHSKLFEQGYFNFLSGIPIFIVIITFCTFIV